MSLAGKYAGEVVQCPVCRAMLYLPTAKKDKNLVRWRCTCGMGLKARAKAFGCSYGCPRCGTINVVPGGTLRAAMA